MCGQCMNQDDEMIRHTHIHSTNYSQLSSTATSVSICPLDHDDDDDSYSLQSSGRNSYISTATARGRWDCKIVMTKWFGVNTRHQTPGNTENSFQSRHSGNCSALTASSCSSRIILLMNQTQTQTL